jgi:hypothetical protein
VRRNVNRLAKQVGAAVLECFWVRIKASRCQIGARLVKACLHQGDIMTVKPMDNVGIVAEDINAAIEFFTELGLELKGRAQSKEIGQMT